MDSNYEAVIGLEVHAQLSTKTKIFCGCSTEFGELPNSNICPVCLGHPGVLPVLNRNVVEYTVLMGLATNCRINAGSIFARKNYFYPDLPKGYQISQFDKPVCEFGFVEVEAGNKMKKKIHIKRIHMEEDAGKSIHDQGEATLIDLNRTGVPLMEIVSEPDISSAQEAYQYMHKLHQLVTYLGICDGNMEQGSLRCDANISVRKKGCMELGTRTEVKNMNSFRNVERAINYEIERQIDILEDGGQIVQETLLWNIDQGKAVPMRGKEEAHDYRYFPDPDLMPVIVGDDWKDEIRISMPELPDKKKQRFIDEYNLSLYDAEVLTSNKGVADYFEEVVKITDQFKVASNWVMGDVSAYLNESKISINEFPVAPMDLGKLITLIHKNVISGKIAKEVFADMLVNGKNPELIIKEKNLVQITDTSEIEKIVESVLDKNSSQVEQYLSGKEKVFGFFIGQIMRETKGKANPKIVNEILKEKLNQRK